MQMLRSDAMRFGIHIATLGGILLMANPISACAQSRTAIDVAALGPQVGERIPDFSLPDQHGQLQSLRSVRGPNGSLILFHRSADW